jgi:hypothetical protein
MSDTAAQAAAASWRIRRRNRGAQMVANLPTHLASVGLTAVGLDAVTAALAASWVISEVDGLAWVALTSGTVGAGVLAGSGPVMSDGNLQWKRWSGFVTAQPSGPS